ncbi:MAG: T9SS type A sorting domain-containing protein [Bacteroidales bacterium]|nr:T9SS type A sorting domain-containing protein [Bacteroidales bacterium]
MTITLDGATLVKDTDYEMVFSSNTNVGTAKITIKGIGNYEGETFKEFQIISRDIEAAVISDIDDVTYNGNAFAPEFSVTLADKTLVLNTDYDFRFENNTNVGIASLIVTAKGNYSGKIVKNFKIKAQNISAAEVSSVADQTFTGAAIKPVITVKLSGKELKENTDFDVVYNDNVNVGTATAKITGILNHEGSKSLTFNILQRSINDAEVSGVADKVYDGTAQTCDFTVKIGNNTLAASKDFDFVYDNNTNVGTAKLTITGKGNYKDVIVKQFMIKGVDISAATVTTLDDFLYAGDESTPYFEVELDGAKLNKDTDYDFVFVSNAFDGFATLTITGKGNYSGEIVKTFEVIPVPDDPIVPVPIGGDDPVTPVEPGSSDDPAPVEPTDVPTPVEIVFPSSNALTISTYPNPAVANQSFKVSFGNAPASGIDLYIFKADGKLVKKAQKLTSETQIMLPSGAYFCVGVVNGMKVSSKIIVK